MEYTREFTHGTAGEDVKAFQTNLLTLGYELPQWGADSQYGDETEAAAQEFCHAHHLDHCWEPCPVWLQEKVHEEAAAVPPEPDIWMPEGKGMFIQSFNSISGPEEVVAVVEEVGLTWVVIQALWQYADQSSKGYNWPDTFGLRKGYGCTKRAQECVTRLREHGVHVLPFAYPVPGKHEECIEILSRFAEAWGSPAVIADPEDPFKSETGAHLGAAQDLSGGLCEAFDSWGMSTYGAPWYHRSFPYEGFNTAPYGLPQTYSNFWLAVGKLARAHDEWTNLYGFKRLLTLYGTYSKTSSELAALLAIIEKMKPRATAGWKWGSTSEVEWDLIAEMAA